MTDERRKLVVGNGRQPDLKPGLGDPDPAHPGQTIAALAGSEDLLDLAANTADRPVPLLQPAQGFLAALEASRQLMTVPGIGPICAVAITALAPPASTFTKGRDFAAGLGLTPRQNSTGGKTRLGKTSKMGQRDLRRLLIMGAMSVVQLAARRGAPEGSWLARMLARKPKMLVAVALANKIARIAWALMARGGAYRSGRRLKAIGWRCRECGGFERRFMGEQSRRTGLGKPG